MTQTDDAEAHASAAIPPLTGGVARTLTALSAALAILGRPRPDLLAAYRWSDEFLEGNPGLRL